MGREGARRYDKEYLYRRVSNCRSANCKMTKWKIVAICGTVLLIAATVTGGDFGNGDTATATIETKGNPALSGKTLLIDARIISP